MMKSIGRHNFLKRLGAYVPLASVSALFPRRILSFSGLDQKNPGRADFRIIGIGGAGSNTLEYLIEQGVPRRLCTAINTDFEAIELSSAKNLLPIGKHTAKGKGAKGDACSGREAANESLARIRGALSDIRTAVLLAGLGGGTGSGAIPLIAKCLKERGAKVYSIVFTPFQFEGDRRNRQAAEAIAELRSIADDIRIIPCEMLRHSVSKSDKFTQIFENGNQMVMSHLKKIEGFPGEI